MRKFHIELAAILYRYYNEGAEKEIAYLATLSSLLVSAFIIILTLGASLGMLDDIAYILDLSKYKSHSLDRKLQFALVVIPALILFRFIFPEKEITQIRLSEKKYKFGIRLFFALNAISFFILAMLVKQNAHI